MKVLLIDVNCKNSSTGRIVYDLYTNLNAAGDEAAICYGRGEKIREPNIYKFGLDWETKLHALLTRLTGRTGCYSSFSTRRLLDFLKDFRPDVVHIHELHAYFVNIKPLLRYLKKNGIKTIFTLHCEFMYTGKCGHAMDCQRWKSLCGHCPKVKDYPKSLGIDQTKQMFLEKKRLYEGFENLTITAPSQWLASRAGKSMLGAWECQVIHNGIDTAVFAPCDAEQLRSTLGIRPEEKVVLALAPHVMSEAKGGQQVLKLAQALPDVRFVIVGADEPPIETPANVILKGPIYDKGLLAQYYSLADLFVICSTRENFPTTCLEAQCCGTPVFGYDAGGTKETALGSTDGFVAYGDISALAERIAKAPRKIAESVALLRERAVKAYGKQQMFARYKQLYQD